MLHASGNVKNLLQNAGIAGAGLTQAQWTRIFETMAVEVGVRVVRFAAGCEEVLIAVLDREDSYLRAGEEKLCDIFFANIGP